MAKEIKQPQLASYSSQYFQTAGGGVKFMCPASGATTPNSNNPRTELRHLKEFTNANQQWQMDCVLRFDRLPTNCDVVGMQIHDGVDDVTVLRRIGSELYVSKGDNFDYKRIATGIGDDTILNMSLVAVKGGGFQWFRDGAFVADRGGTRKGLYFKAGCYVQRGNNPSGFGEVTIFSLTVRRTG